MAEDSGNKSDACYVEPGPTDSGRMAIALAWQIAAAALAAVNVVTSSQLAAKQFALAQRYFRIAREWRDWYNRGFVPLEDMELDEIWAEGLHDPYYDAAAGRAAATAKLAFADKVEAALRCTDQYATGLRQALLKDGSRLLAESAAAAEGMGLRNERAHVEAMNDMRWKHREAAVMRGRNMAASNVAYAQLASGIYGDLANQAGQAAGGYMRFIGYAQERLKTMYPAIHYYRNGAGTRQVRDSVTGENWNPRWWQRVSAEHNSNVADDFYGSFRP
jgi:hypothetical protein